VELRFDPSQEYQLEAIESVAGLLEGQPYVGYQLTVPPGATFAVVSNRLDLPEEDLLANLRKIQFAHGLVEDEALQCIESTVETVSGEASVRFPNFSVEMETGTGKTYVYLRTAFELYRRYGLRKFIVVVPSIAVREGVLTTIRIAGKHLRELYGNSPFRSGVYDSARLSTVRQFSLSDGLEVLVMTIDAFSKSENIIHQRTDDFQGEKPIHVIQATRPILILDEPQNMESEKRVAALAALHPLFALRYSATHRNPYNVVHRLTPYEAYRQGLVKRIEVAAAVEEDNANRPFLRIDDITTKGKTLRARVAVQKLMKSGAIQEATVIVKPGDDLVEKTSRPEYAGFVVDEISFGGGFVRFANGDEIPKGATVGPDQDALHEAQIRFTVESHFQKQARLRPLGVKVLSLFFVDRVDSYALEDGFIRRMFFKAFEELKAKYPEWAKAEPRDVQAAYFASRRKRSGEVEALDTTGRSREDEAAFQLIMRNKEQLLSFDEPVAFIFSHSALREGWDNPNVFQVCTLREVGSELERRQQVGRGIRLPVDQSGERIRDEKVNILTVVASETYERFISGYQSEIEAAYGKEGVPPPPPNARRRAKLNLRKHYLLKPEFRELWGRIKHKTRYSVSVDTESLLQAVIPELDGQPIRPPRITIQKAEIVATAADLFEAMAQSGAKTAIDLRGRFPLPNVVEVMESLMEHTSPPMRVSRRTLFEVFRRSAKKQAAVDNPHEFATIAVRTLKAKLTDQLVDGIRYEKIDAWYEMTQFQAELETWTEYFMKSERPDGSEGAGLYDGAIVESESIERAFVEALERRRDVILYVKLPD
jgi:type III restriction enzyme